MATFFEKKVVGDRFKINGKHSFTSVCYKKTSLTFNMSIRRLNMLFRGDHPLGRC